MIARVSETININTRQKDNITDITNMHKITMRNSVLRTNLYPVNLMSIVANSLR